MNRVLGFLAVLLLSINLGFAAQVDVNTASDKELQTLNGIGPVKAKAIVDYRSKNGPFKTVDELDKVPGIGKATLDKIRKDVTLSKNNKSPTAPMTTETKGAASSGKSASSNRSSATAGEKTQKTPPTGKPEKSSTSAAGANNEPKSEKKSSAK